MKIRILMTNEINILLMMLLLQRKILAMISRWRNIRSRKRIGRRRGRWTRRSAGRTEDVVASGSSSIAARSTQIGTGAEV